MMGAVVVVAVVVVVVVANSSCGVWCQLSHAGVRGGGVVLRVCCPPVYSHCRTGSTEPLVHERSLDRPPPRQGKKTIVSRSHLFDKFFPDTISLHVAVVDTLSLRNYREHVNNIHVFMCTQRQEEEKKSTDRRASSVLIYDTNTENRR